VGSPLAPSAARRNDLDDVSIARASKIRRRDGDAPVPVVSIGCHDTPVTVPREDADPVAAFSAAEDVHDLGALSTRVPQRPEQNAVAGLGSGRTSDAPDHAGVIPNNARRAMTRACVGPGASRASSSAGTLVDALHEAVMARAPVAALHPFEPALAQERLEKGSKGCGLRAATAELAQKRFLAADGAGVAPEHLQNRFACESHAL
jgi:hypothetical protein